MDENSYYNNDSMNSDQEDLMNVNSEEANANLEAEEMNNVEELTARVENAAESDEGERQAEAEVEVVITNAAPAMGLDETRARKKRSFMKTLGMIAAAAAVAGIVASGSLQLARQLAASENEQQSGGVISAPNIDELDIADNDGDITIEQVSNVPVSYDDVSAVAENVMPSVVSVECRVVTTSQNYFGIPQQQEGTSSGSGFIIGQNSSELLIATNNHVISGAAEVKVIFIDGSSATATVKGADEYYDLAVLSLDVSALSDETLSQIKIATLGDSDSLSVGSMTIAIGNALGYGQSLTGGYISALNREVTVDGNKMVLLQTDAAINPGNSGGPLLNIYGEVIGINSVKYASTNVEGIGYAIPISTAIPIINELMNREELSETERGYLGITGKNVEESFASGFNMPIGAYVYKVTENGAAAEAGVVPGDIIVGVNSRSISSMEELVSVLKYMRSGTEVELQIKRMENEEYIEKTISVVLGGYSA